MARQRDVGEKPRLHRRAVAEGELRVKPATRNAIRARQVEKGDPLAAGELAGLLAMKRTSELIPHCHAVPLTSSSVELQLSRQGVRVRAESATVDRTGVEMEALVGATVALLTVWDMVKYLEKDARGLYPATSIGPVRVVAKAKSGTEGA
ncbi:MAG TPA: cyclic pyranopterin monophosphate synthase MoaC [Thermoplasmata archaeon]|jgi:cyclic pyranopterin phosphate synthase|nr:cyclic pyranopterin monophosphate synthase MoaC [Thermoplasmata archaeon]